MVCFPEARIKAQKELDSVLAPGLLPDFDDETSLPYISAFVKEVIRSASACPALFRSILNENSSRWQPVTPIGLLSVSDFNLTADAQFDIQLFLII